MKIIKYGLSIILWVSTFLLLLLELYLFIMPYVWCKRCIPEEGCMNESGVLIVAGIFLLPLFVILLASSIVNIYCLIKAKRKTKLEKNKL